MNSVYSLLEATLTLYPADANDAPVLASPVWFGACGNDLKLTEHRMVRQTFPGARRFPKNHAIVATHEINIGRLWVLPEPSLPDYETTSSRYVLDIVWDNEDFSGWRRRTYYGVTCKTYDLASQERIQFNAEQSFDAEYYHQSAGTGAAPPLSGSLAYTVVWTSAAEPALVLYDYSAATKLFTERTAGAAASRATITVGAVFASLNISFTGDAGAALTINASQVTTIHALNENVPTPADLARLDFMYGASRLASVKYGGGLFVENLDEITPAAGGARYQLYGGNVLAATLAPDAGVFESLVES